VVCGVFQSVDAKVFVRENVMIQWVYIYIYNYVMVVWGVYGLFSVDQTPVCLACDMQQIAVLERKRQGDVYMSHCSAYIHVIDHMCNLISV
jgi:hypothetical protein